MNIKLVLKLVGRVLLIEAAALAVPLAAALIYREDPLPFLLSIAVVAGIGFALSALPAKQQFFTREGFVAVGLIWIFTGLVGALPFILCGYFATPIDAIFESCSGFTTTGSTILTDIESLPKGILFWRAFTHWLGGMGVLVLATAIVPKLGIRSHYLTQAETPGPVFSKLVPKQSQTSKILYTMYFVLTALEVLCLKIAGLPLYDALIHSFSTAGTGGFSNRNASVGAYGNVAVEMIITVFMLLFSVNFAIYFLLLTKKWREAVASDELRFFLAVVLGSTAILTLVNSGVYASLWESFRYTVFQIAAIISTTGFGTADFVLWPQFSQLILVLIMFCGACAGSTGGGMKCSRVLLLLRALRVHPAHPAGLSGRLCGHRLCRRPRHLSGRPVLRRLLQRRPHLRQQRGPRPGGHRPQRQLRRFLRAVQGRHVPVHDRGPSGNFPHPGPVQPLHLAAYLSPLSRSPGLSKIFEKRY